MDILHRFTDLEWDISQVPAWVFAHFVFVQLVSDYGFIGREYGFHTPSDYLRTRYYSEGFGLFVAILLTVFIIPYTTLQLITIGDGIATTTNGAFPYMLAVLFGTVCVSLHIIGGGMKSVAWLDTLDVYKRQPFI